ELSFWRGVYRGTTGYNGRQTDFGQALADRIRNTAPGRTGDEEKKDGGGNEEFAQAGLLAESEYEVAYQEAHCNSKDARDGDTLYLRGIR
ncbi:unnamed protein product, partial [Discosporangium mesarthrocarpum]